MMIAPRCHLVLLFGFILTDVDSFSIPVKTTTKRRSTTSQLFATGLGSADAYLNSISPQLASVSTDYAAVGATPYTAASYLNGLAQFSSEASEAASPAEYLKQVSQLASDAGSFYLADATGGVEDAIPDTSQLADGASNLIAGAEDATQSAASSLSSQLSDMSYGSLVDGEKAVQQVAASSAKAVDFSKFGDFAANAKASLGAVASDSAQMLQSLFGDSKLIQDASSTMSSVQSSAEVKSIGELAQTVASGLYTVGTTVFNILDTFLDSVAGTSVAELIGNAQHSIQNLVNGALENVAATVAGIGNMSVGDATQSLVALLVFISKIVFAALNAVVKVLSGQSVQDWAIAATKSVEYQGQELLAQANAAVTDLSHKSLSEVTVMAGDFAHNVGDLAQNVGRIVTDENTIIAVADSALGNAAAISAGVSSATAQLLSF